MVSFAVAEGKHGVAALRSLIGMRRNIDNLPSRTLMGFALGHFLHGSAANRNSQLDPYGLVYSALERS